MSIRSVLYPLVLAAAVTLLPPLAAQEKPDFTGAWKLKPNQNGGEGPASVLFRIEHKEPAFKYTATGRSSRGEPFSERYEFTTDGKPGAATGSLAVSGQWEGEALVVRYTVRDNEIARSTLRLSAGGGQMLRDVAFKGRPAFREVYERQ